MKLFLFYFTVFVCLQSLNLEAFAQRLSPNLHRRQVECTGACGYCADAWKLTWISESVRTITPYIIHQTILEDGSVISSTEVISQTEDIAELSTAQANEQGTRITTLDDITLTFPTAYLSLISGSYSHVTSGCTASTRIGIDDLPVRFPALSVDGSSPDDLNGLKYDLWFYPYAEDIAQYLVPQAQTCSQASSCPPAFLGLLPSDPRKPFGPTAALSAAFVTPTVVTTQTGGGGSNPQNPVSADNPGDPAPPTAASAPPAQPNPPSNPTAAPPPTSGGVRITTTDSGGSPIIVTAAPGPTAPPAHQPVTAIGPGGEALVITGGTPVVPGQVVTMTDSRGSAVVSTVQSGVNGEGFVTYTDSSGSVGVILGGTTGTLVEQGTSTVLVQGGTTYSEWQGTVTTTSAESVGGSSGGSKAAVDFSFGTVCLMLLLSIVTVTGSGLI